MLNIEYFDASGNATEAGIFIPVSNLPGIQASELATAASGKESKAILAIHNALYAYFSDLATLPLGVVVGKTAPSGAGLDFVNVSFTSTFNYLVNHESGTVGPVPVPTTGTNTGLGGLELIDVFPAAAKVAASGSTGAAGILIPTSELIPYGSPSQASLAVNADSRSWFAALSLYMAVESTLRTTADASAVVTRSVGAGVGASFPTAWTQPTNPVSGIAAADLPKRSLISRSFGLTIQLLLDQETQQFDVRSVTA